MGLIGRLKEKFGGGSGHDSNNGGWDVLEQTRKSSSRVQQEEARHLAEQKRLEDQRQQGKIVGYFLTDDPQILASSRVRFSSADERDVLLKMKDGRIDERREVDFLSKIANNFDSPYYDEDELCHSIMSDPVQMSILGIAVDDLRERRGLETNGVVSEATIANFADECMDMSPEDDYRTPVGFEKFKREFLDGISKYHPENYEQAMDGVERLENAIYGKQYEYYKQLQKMHEKADVMSNYAEISPSERDYVLRNAEIDGDAYWSKDGVGYGLGVDDYEKAGLDPRFKVNVDGKEVFLSSVFDVVGNRLASIGYVPAEDGKMKMRSFYRSSSQGLWRYMPDYAQTGSKKGAIWFGKGHAEEALNLPSEMQEALNSVALHEKKRDVERIDRTRNNPAYGDPMMYFAGTAKCYKSKKDYARNLYGGTMKGDFYHEVNDKGTSLMDVSEYSHPTPESVECNFEKEPNYSDKVGGYSALTPLSGSVKAEIFRSNDGSLKWTILSDVQGRAWVGQVETGAPMTSTGVRSEWIQPGALATPLYEYKDYCGGYGDAQDVNGPYCSMWKNYLSRVPMIKRYVARKS